MTGSPRGVARVALSALILAYAALYVFFYPPLSAIADEVGFVNQALVWSRGAVSSEASGFAEVTDFGPAEGPPHLMDFVPAKGRHVSSRHPGRSLVLLPFLAAGGVEAGFGSGLLIHLGVTLVSAALLARLGRSPLWAAAVLFHPTLAIYSRTIMGDEAAGGSIVLAALLATWRGPAGAAGAGLACGLAALMRYHAGLALPIVAASIATDRLRDRPGRDALACLAAGGSVALLIVAYNLALYGRPGDAVGASRGTFGLRYVPENLPFYAAALLVVWPGMLLAPLLDRSDNRRIARGVAGAYLAFFSAYYFHDRGAGLAETLVLGLRLLQVALPIWIVSHATVVDDRVVAPIRRRAGGRPVVAIVAVLIVGVVSADAVAFAKHQRHLRAWADARDALEAELPGGALVVDQGGYAKLFGIPRPGRSYRWRMFDYLGTPIDHEAELNTLDRPWYLALFAGPGRPIPPAALAMVDRHRMRRVETPATTLVLYRADPGPGPR